MATQSQILDIGGEIVLPAQPDSGCTHYGMIAHAEARRATKRREFQQKLARALRKEKMKGMLLGMLLASSDTIKTSALATRLIQEYVADDDYDGFMQQLRKLCPDTAHVLTLKSFE